MVAVRRAREKARRIVRKDLCQSIRHVIGKYVLLDAVPYAEQKMAAGLEDALRFAIAGRAVGKEHRAELATNEIEGGVFKRQRQSVRLAPCDARCREAVAMRRSRASAG